MTAIEVTPEMAEALRIVDGLTPGSPRLAPPPPPSAPVWWLDFIVQSTYEESTQTACLREHMGGHRVPIAWLEANKGRITQAVLDLDDHEYEWGRP